MRATTIGPLIVALLVVLAACKPRSNSSTKAIVTKDRQNAVAFLPMRQYSTNSMLEIRAVSCGQDPSLSWGKPEVLMNILESGVQIDPAALYYRGTILVTANDSLINIQGYAVSHNCRVQLSVPAIGANGFYALFADKSPELEPLRQTIWLALRGPYRGNSSTSPTLDAFISEVLQATRTPAKATRANELLDDRYNPCLPSTADLGFNKLKYYSCLVESGSRAANYVSKTDNLPEIREKLKNIANHLAKKQISESEIDQVADLFGMNFVVGGSMAIRKTGAVARLASFGLERPSIDHSEFSLQETQDISANSNAQNTTTSGILGTQTVTKVSPLTKGSGSLEQVNSGVYRRESKAIEQILGSSEYNKLKGYEEASKKQDSYAKMNSITSIYGTAGMWEATPRHTYPIIAPKPSDPKPATVDELRVPPPQKDYRPNGSGAAGGYSIDTKKVPNFDPTKTGALPAPKPLTSATPVETPDGKVDAQASQPATTYGARCKELGGSMVGVLCVCPDDGSPGARLTVNPENTAEISCKRKREYLMQEQAKESAALLAQKKEDETKRKEQEHLEKVISQLEQGCAENNAKLDLPPDRKPISNSRYYYAYCVCNNKTARRFAIKNVRDPYEPLYDKCKTDEQIATADERCRKESNAVGSDGRGNCVCPSGWVWVSNDSKCHWASAAWLYRDSPKEVSHYEQADKGSWLDRINPFKGFWDKVTEPLID